MGSSFQTWSWLVHGRTMFRSVLFDMLGRPVHHAEGATLSGTVADLHVSAHQATVSTTGDADVDRLALEWLGELEQCRAHNRAIAAREPPRQASMPFKE